MIITIKNTSQNNNCVLFFVFFFFLKDIPANAERSFLKYSRAGGTYLWIGGPEFKQTEITSKKFDAFT